jgi:hypothetical protein
MNVPASPTTPESIGLVDTDVVTDDGPRILHPSSSRSRMSISKGKEEKRTLGGLARRTLGIILLLSTVFLWTVSNFLASVRSNSPSLPIRRKKLTRVDRLSSQMTLSPNHISSHI